MELAVPADSLAEYLGKFPEVGEGQERRIGYIVSPNPRATYAAMVSRLDRDGGRILELLKSLGVDEGTVVIFNSDNGAQARFDVSEDFFEATAGLRGYKGSMYEGGLRIPQIVRWPGQVKAGAVSNCVTYFPDMMPTFAELAGVESPQNDGISIVPTPLGKGKQRDHAWLSWDLVAASNKLRKQAARRGKWKCVRESANGSVELYDLEADKAERTDLADAHQELVRESEKWPQENRTNPRTSPPVQRSATRTTSNWRRSTQPRWAPGFGLENDTNCGASAGRNSD